MFVDSNRQARKSAMRAFKKERRDIFEGLDSEGRTNVVNALQARLGQLKNRPESEISRQFRNSPFVKQRVEEFAKLIDAERRKYEKEATKALQAHIDAEQGRFDEMVQRTKVQRQELNKLKKEARDISGVLKTASKVLLQAESEQERLKKELKKAKEEVARIKASGKTLDAATKQKVKDRFAKLQAAEKESANKVKEANNEVYRLQREQKRLNADMINKQEGLNAYEAELDLRDEGIMENEIQIQIRMLSEIVFTTKKQALDVIEQIVVSHPVSVKASPNFIQEDYKGMVEGYALLCENTADTIGMSLSMLQDIKGSGMTAQNGVEVFAYAESAEDYLTNLVDIMQDLSEKANRTATALGAHKSNIGFVKRFFEDISVNIPPYQAIDFALTVRDHYYTIKQESEEIARIGGRPDLNRDRERFSKSRLAKFIANAEDISGTTEDGLIERINSAKAADKADSPLLWYRDTNAQYNEIIGKVGFDDAVDTLMGSYDYTTPSVGFVGTASDSSAAARIGADYALPELQRKYDELKAAEMEERDKLAGIMQTDPNQVKMLKLGEFAGEAMGSAARLLKERTDILNLDERIKANPSKRKMKRKR